MACVTLITDYGTRDHYVGAIKGVIHTLAPNVPVFDVTHEIPPHDVLHAAFVLRQVWHWYPPGTVHLTVVDPGVGTQRRILVGRYGGQFAVAPDNGLLSMVHHEVPIEELRVVENMRWCMPVISATFHGRDILAPVAARIAAGQLAPRDFGPVTDRIEVLRIPPPAPDADGGLTGSVLSVDRFGNLITNIRATDLHKAHRGRGELMVYVNDRCVGPVRARYADVAPGEALALIGGGEHLEISVNQGSAAERFPQDRAARIRVRDAGRD